MDRLPDQLRLYTEAAQAFAVRHRLKDRVRTAFTTYRKRTYAAIGVFAVILIVLVVSAGSGSPPVTPATAIEQVLNRDREIGMEGRKAVKGGQSPRVAVATVVQSMKAIDLRPCPPDFREAYARHASAWEAMALELREQPETFGEGFMLGLGNMLSRGEMDGGQQRLAERRDKRMDEVRVTWTEVEALAARYGAMLPAPMPGD